MPRVRASELVGRGWLNTGGRELSLQKLRGKIVLLDFWTFCCINCLHVIDELRPLEEKYHDVLVTIGVHSPKFVHEADPDALAAAVERYDVAHPVLDDPDLVTWIYKLAFKAQNEVAEKFQDWLAIEVIPKIRKTGGYVQEDRADDFVNAWLPQLDDVSRKAIATALESNRKLQTENKELITTIQEQRPKVVFAESCLVSNDAVLVKDVAKLACDQGMKIGQNRLYNKLREWGYIQKKDTQPTQRAIESGFFEILQRSIQTPEGSKLTRTTKVTPKGQMHIINKLKKEQLEGVFN